MTFKHSESQGRYDKYIEWKAIREYQFFPGSYYREINPIVRKLVPKALKLDRFMVRLTGDAYSYEMLRERFGLDKRIWHPSNTFDHQDVQKTIRDLGITPIHRNLILTVRHQAPEEYRDKSRFKTQKPRRKRP
jgi:hypothetical protein